MKPIAFRPDVLRPAEHVFTCGNLAFAAIWATVGTVVPSWPLWMSVHLVGALLPFILSRLPEPSFPVAAAWREIYPLFGIALFWSALGAMNRSRPETAFHDAWVRDLDAWLFGSHLHLGWKHVVPEAWFALGMDMFYLGYYLLVFGLPIAFICGRRQEALRDATYRLLYTYLSCYLLYAFFPVHGPRIALSGEAGTGTWLAAVEDSLRRAGDSPGTAFPSSHVAGVFAAALIARRWLPRPLGNAWLLAAFGVAASTVYTQNHYTIDAIFGMALALVLDRVMPRRGSKEEAPQPTLRPRFPRPHPGPVLTRGARVASLRRVRS